MEEETKPIPRIEMKNLSIEVRPGIVIKLIEDGQWNDEWLFDITPEGDVTLGRWGVRQSSEGTRKD